MNTNTQNFANGQHGWVTPRADGAKARFGGPSLCPTCRQERDASWPVIDATLLPAKSEPASVEAAMRLGFEPFAYTERS